MCLVLGILKTVMRCLCTESRTGSEGGGEAKGAVSQWSECRHRQLSSSRGHQQGKLVMMFMNTAVKITLNKLYCTERKIVFVRGLWKIVMKFWATHLQTHGSVCVNSRMRVTDCPLTLSHLLTLFFSHPDRRRRRRVRCCPHSWRPPCWPRTVKSSVF